MIKLNSPFTKEEFSNLKTGDSVLVSGTIYTARDQAHKRMCESLAKGEKLPFDIKNSIIYYCGPSPAKPGDVIGSAGPTTSYRMDAYAPILMDIGGLGMIGKGQRSDEVVVSMKKNGAVYFAAIGGAGAYMSRCIKEAKVIAYEDLGAEAVRELRVEDMPLIVAIDSKGNSLYEK